MTEWQTGTQGMGKARARASAGAGWWDTPSVGVEKPVSYMSMSAPATILVIYKPRSTTSTGVEIRSSHCGTAPSSKTPARGWTSAAWSMVWSNPSYW